jgi:hypothetical protein
MIRTLHDAVVRAAEKETNPARITQKTIDSLGLPEAALPVISRTVAGHIRALNRGEKTG